MKKLKKLLEESNREQERGARFIGLFSIFIFVIVILILIFT